MEIDKCDVLRCRQEAFVSCLGVWLCEKHHSEYCDGTDLKTSKGTLTHRLGRGVLE